MAPDRQRDMPTPITNPSALLAMTHPLRMRLIGELAARGTARVIDLATALGEPTNSVSFHLRQLAKYGVIEDNPDRAANARERWWRMASDRGLSVDLDTLEQLDGGKAAAQTFRQVAEGHVVAIYRAIRDHREHGGHPAEKAPVISDDFVVRLRPTELQQMRDEFDDLLTRWMDKSRALTDTDDSEERHTYYGVVMAALTREIIAHQFGSGKDPQA